MIDKNEKTKLLKYVQTGVAFVEVNGLDLPYTLCDSRITGNPPSCTDEELVLYNLYTDEYDAIPTSDIGIFTTWINDKFEPRDEQAVTRCELAKEELKSCIDDKSIDTSPGELMKIYFTTGMGILDWEALKHFKFKYTLEELREPTETLLEEIRAEYMNLIRAHRENSFEELDQLETEAKKEETSVDDLKDIDMIKQMFRDIPQETDLSQYETIESLYNFWPSLLLPKPDDILTTAHLLVLLPQNSGFDSVTTDHDAAKQHLIEILGKIDDPEELKAILQESEVVQDTLPVYTITLIEERLKYLQ
jgi:hypothetical protein